MTRKKSLEAKDHPMSVSFRSDETTQERYIDGTNNTDDWEQNATEGGGETPLGQLDDSEWEKSVVGEDEEGSRGLGSRSSSTTLRGAGQRTDRPAKNGDADSISIPAEIKESLIRQDGKVRRLKALVVIFLIAAAVVVTALIYTSTKNAEHDDFRVQYAHVATRVKDSFKHIMQMRVWTAYTLSAVYTGHSRSGISFGQSSHEMLAPWPNFTLLNFAEQTLGTVVLARAVDVTFNPLVSAEDRPGWEAYASEVARKIHASHGDTGRGTNVNRASPMNMVAAPTGGRVPTQLPTSTPMAQGFRDANKGETAAEQAGHTANIFEGGRARNLRGVPVSETEDETEASQADMDTSHDDADSGNNNTYWNDHGPDNPLHTSIYKINGTKHIDEDDLHGPFAPVWQISPAIGNEDSIMFNLRSEPTHRQAIDHMLQHRMPTLTEVFSKGTVDYHVGDHIYDSPSSALYYPVFDQFNGPMEIVGMIGVSFSWINNFSDVLPVNIKGITCVLETNTGQQSTFRIDGKKAVFIGDGDLHDRQFDQYVWVYENDIHNLGDHEHRRLTVNNNRRMEQDVHDGEYSQIESQTSDEHAHKSAVDDLVRYTVRIYPSSDFVASYQSNQPLIYAVSVALIFFVTVSTFILYDCLVERRQMKIMQTVVQSTKLVNSLFPAVVRDRLFRSQHEEPEADEEAQEKRKGVRKMLPRKMSSIMMMHTGHQDATANLKRFLTPASQGDDDLTALSGSLPPIADLFPETTVMFGDIAGFTAWSSEREPAQVFQLLEALFREFDLETKKHGVFKVETIGDCYVAVTGLPDPHPEHALAMARFAQRCLIKFSELTKELELSLGPGTAELGMRIGLHSGPTTAGVLRGDKSRFQLFGDTMNTASRMESTGIENMIQVSQETADRLKAAGKGHSLVPRQGVVQAKGKGALQTYWLRPKAVRRTSSQFSCAFENTSQPSLDDVDNLLTQAEEHEDRAELGLPPVKKATQEQSVSSATANEGRSKQQPTQSIPLASIRDESWKDTGLKDYGTDAGEGLQRLVKWNTAVLESIIAKGIVHREKRKLNRRGMWTSSRSILNLTKMEEYNASAVFSEEIAEAVEFPRFNSDTLYDQFLCKSSVIPPQVRKELHDYVTRVASMYRNVPFHNFDHASHVTMSANKLINKVCSRNGCDYADGEEKKIERDLGKRRGQVELFFSTYGISADFLAQFAVVFAALVHDVGHTGVPNVQLIKEKPDLALQYKNKSVAENNSIAIAWRILKEPQFENLRKCIFATDGDESRFRQLLINVVIATDIADKERRAGEKKRWETAFNDVTQWQDEWQGLGEHQLAKVDISLKATVVLEQIVLASDVAHTMQHWLTYVKWNEKLYKELWSAYKSGRAEKDPTLNWYEGEIGFFNGYIIPLASKLKECGVFGSAGEEYLGNAVRNREEWIDKGRKITARFEETIKNAPQQIT
mmetsp:Transcript_41571/g.126014  ORF Transcript_41571/g.126014 Transcript_41571/m.126014 type:complete len:1447 (-) Transcript_41571:64-4404(-)